LYPLPVSDITDKLLKLEGPDHSIWRNKNTAILPGSTEMEITAKLSFIGKNNPRKSASSALFAFQLLSGWGNGANENTVIAFSHAVKFAGQSVPAGQYGLFFIVNKDDSGEVILSKDYRSWGSFFYDPAQDQLRAKIKCRTIPNTDLLSYDFINLNKNGGELVLNWEKKQFPVSLEFAVDDIVMANAGEELKGPVGFNWQGPYSAADYALQNNIHLEKALGWADQAIAQNKNFGTLHVKAALLRKTGKTAEAEKIETEALTLANEAELNQHGYNLINEKRMDDGIKVFILNTERNPKSANAWDSLGQGYALKGDKANAIASFKKSLSLNPPEAVKANSEKYLKQLGGCRGCVRMNFKKCYFFQGLRLACLYYRFNKRISLMKRTLCFRFSAFTIFYLCLFAGIFPQTVFGQGWIKNYGIPGNNWQGHEIEKLADGGYIIGGQTQAGHNVIIARLDQEGDTLWTKIFPGEEPWGSMWIQDMKTDANGRTHIILFNLVTWWSYYVRLDLEGNIETEYSIYPGSTSEYLSALSLVDDGIVFAGALSETDSTLIFKKSFNGDLIWTNSLPTKGGVVEMRQDAEGNFILIVEIADYDYEIVKTDPNGNFLWRVLAPGDIYRGSIAIQPDGAVVFASALDPVIQLIQISADGVVVNLVEDNIFPDIQKIVERIITDTEGNLYLTGTVWMTPGEDHDLLLIKYSPDLIRLGFQTFDEGENFWIGRDLEITYDEGLIVCGTQTTKSDTGASTNLITVFKLPIEAVTGIEEAVPGETCQVQPNPFSDYLLFNLKEAGPGLKTISIYSPEGKLLRIEEFSGMQYHMRSYELPMGFLFYEIKGNGRVLASGRLIRK